MRQYTFFIILAITSMLSFQGMGQKATEQFIPIGQSPGISGKTTVIGNVESINESNFSVTVKLTDGTTKTFMISSKSTKIYADRSKTKEQSSAEAWTIIRAGLLVEIKYADLKTNKPVEWVKVQVK